MGSQIYWWWSRSQKVIFEICFCVKGVVVVGRGRGGGGWAFVCFWLLRRIRRKIKPLKLSLYGCFHFCLQSVFVYQNWRILWLGHFILQLFGVKALVRACSWKDSWLDGLGGGGGVRVCRCGWVPVLPLFSAFWKSFKKCLKCSNQEMMVFAGTVCYVWDCAFFVFLFSRPICLSL